MAAKILKIFTLIALLPAACVSNRFTKPGSIQPVADAGFITKPERVTAGVDSSFKPSLSANGLYMFFASERTGNKDIFVKDVRGGYPAQLTNHPADDYAPSVSPDGTKMAFISKRHDARGSVYVMPLSGVELKGRGGKEVSPSLIVTGAGEAGNPGWFPDSRRLVFNIRASGELNSKICVITAVIDAEPDCLPGITGDYPSVSADSRFVTYSRRGQIYLYSFESGREAALTSSNGVMNGHPRFSNDGKTVYFIRFADDTNHDGRLDSDDRPTIWSVSVAAQLAIGGHLENFGIKQLSESDYAAYYPMESGNYIYFTSQSDGLLDIYRIPAGGALSDAALARAGDEWRGKDMTESETLMVYRRMSERSAQRGETAQAIDEAVAEIRYLLAKKRLPEAKFLIWKIRREPLLSIAQKNILDLIDVEADVSALIAPDRSETLSTSERGDLQGALSRISELSLEGKSNDINLAARRNLLKDQIEVSLGRNSARESLRRRFDGRAESSSLEALAGLEYLIRYDIARGDYRSAWDGLNLFAVSKSQRTLAELSGLFTETVKDLADRPQSFLADVIEDYDSSPTLKSYARKALGESMEDDGNIAGAKAIYEAVVQDGSVEKTALFGVLDSLVSLYENEGEFVAAERLLINVRADKRDFDTGVIRELDERLARFYIRLGDTMLRGGDNAEALLIYRKSLAIRPDNLSAWTGVLRSQEAAGNLGVLIQEFEVRHRESPSDPRTRYLLGAAIFLQKYNRDEDYFAAVDRCVELVEGARDRMSENAEVHSLLGKIYRAKSNIQSVRLNPSSFEGRARLGWRQTKAVFGVYEPDWNNLALDSGITSYRLAEGDVGLIEKQSGFLGDMYFLNQNYSLSLRYYLKQIELLGDFGRLSEFEKMRLYRHAGRSAFYTENFQIAEATQTRAMQLAAGLNSEIDYAYSMDALALTLRERKKFADAADLYGKLIDFNASRKNRDNLISALVNRAWCYFMMAKSQDALADYDRASGLIQESLGGERSKLGGKGIKIDIAGQHSDAFGFSLRDLLIQVRTFRAAIYEKSGRLEDAIKETGEKVSLLDSKVSEHKKLGFGDGFLAEERSVTLNHLGALQVKSGLYRDAANSFRVSGELASKGRVKDQNHPLRGEWLNLLNEGRAYLRLWASSEADKSGKKELESRIAAAIGDFEKARGSGDREVLMALTGLKSVYAQILGGESDSDAGNLEKSQVLFRDSMQLAEKLGLGADKNLNANLNFDLTLLESLEERAEVSGVQQEFRKAALVNPGIAWKYFASRGAFARALESASLFVAQGGALTERDRLLLKKCLSGAVSAETTGIGNTASDGMFGLLRQYLFASQQAKINQFSKRADVSVSSTSQKALLSLGKEERIGSSLDDGEVLISITRGHEGGFLTALTTNAGTRPQILDQVFQLPGNQARDKMSALIGNDSEIVYVATDDLTLVGEFLKASGWIGPLFVVPTPDALASFHAARTMGKIPEFWPPAENNLNADSQWMKKLASGDLNPVIMCGEAKNQVEILFDFYHLPRKAAASKLGLGCFILGDAGKSPRDFGPDARMEMYDQSGGGRLSQARDVAVADLIRASAAENQSGIYQSSGVLIDIETQNGATAIVDRLKRFRDAYKSGLMDERDITRDLNLGKLSVQSGDVERAKSIVTNIRKSRGGNLNVTQRAELALLSGRLFADSREADFRDVESAIRDLIGRGRLREAALVKLSLADLYSDLNEPIIDQIKIYREALDVIRASRDETPSDAVIMKIAQLEKSRLRFAEAATLIDGHLSRRRQQMPGKMYQEFVLLSVELSCLIDIGSHCAQRVSDAAKILAGESTGDRGFEMLLKLELLKARRQRRLGDLNGAIDLARIVSLASVGRNAEVSISSRILLGTWFAEAAKPREAKESLDLARTLMDEEKSVSRAMFAAYVKGVVTYHIAVGRIQDGVSFIDGLSGERAQPWLRELRHHLALHRAYLSWVAGDSGSAREQISQLPESADTLDDPWFRSRRLFLSGVLSSDQRQSLKMLPQAYASSDPEQLSERDEVILAIWQNAAFSLSESKRFNLVWNLANKKPWVDLADGDCEGVDSGTGEREAVLVAHPIGGMLLLGLAGREGCVTGLLSTSEKMLRLPPEMSNQLKAYKRVTVFADGGRSQVEIGRLLVGDRRLVESIPTRYGGVLASRQVGGSEASGSVRAGGVISSPDQGSMIQKSAKIINRSFPGAHLFDPRVFNAKSLERLIADHDLVLFSLPKEGGAWPWVPSTFRVSGAGPVADLTADKIARIKKSSQSFVAVLPQANQSNDILEALGHLGARTIIVNKGVGDKDADTFYIKNLFRNLRVTDACESARLSEVTTAEYYPKQPTSFRVYGSCDGFAR